MGYLCIHQPRELQISKLIILYIGNNLFSYGKNWSSKAYLHNRMLQVVILKGEKWNDLNIDR